MQQVRWGFCRVPERQHLSCLINAICRSLFFSVWGSSPGTVPGPRSAERGKLVLCCSNLSRKGWCHLRVQENLGPSLQPHRVRDGGPSVQGAPALHTVPASPGTDRSSGAGRSNTRIFTTPEPLRAQKLIRLRASPPPEESHFLAKEHLHQLWTRGQEGEGGERCCSALCRGEAPSSLSEAKGPGAESQVSWASGYLSRDPGEHQASGVEGTR